MTKITTPPSYYSEEEMAAFLGKSVSTLMVEDCHRKNRVPPKTKFGRVIVYSKASFDQWLESQEIKHSAKFPKNYR